jgi:hypothetical protein
VAVPIEVQSNNVLSIRDKEAEWTEVCKLTSSMVDLWDLSEYKDIAATV